ncbi:peptidoglycan DD-metalloendopeptidase family protein [Sulfuritortus calidifontis]|nr:peptidoglycan DD-metalloendopeptidase family protein [Sulfuritortus calidifontis]
MSRPLAWLLLAGLAAMLAGCGSTRWLAPIKEIGKTRKAGPVAESYVVQPGDTLFKIAFEHGLDYRDLAAWNGIADVNLIRAGERLRLLPQRKPSVATAPAKPARNSPPPVEAESPMENEEVAAWIWPARGSLLEGFDEAAGNKGIDIAGSLGTPVLAGAPGRVVYAGEGLRGYGKLIIIKHNQTTLSAYAHHSRILVHEGQTVAQGQKIGEMGSSDSDRVKLHFEIRRFGRPQDPLIYLPKSG